MEQAAEQAAQQVRKDPAKVFRAQTFRGKALNTLSSTCRSSVVSASTYRVSRVGMIRAANFVHAKRSVEWTTRMHSRCQHLQQALESCRLMAQLQMTAARNALDKEGLTNVPVPSGETEIDALSTFLMEHQMSVCMLPQETMGAIYAVWKAEDHLAKQEAYQALTANNVLHSALASVRSTQDLIEKAENGETVPCPTPVRRSARFVPGESPARAKSKSQHLGPRSRMCRPDHGGDGPLIGLLRVAPPPRTASRKPTIRVRAPHILVGAARHRSCALWCVLSAHGRLQAAVDL